MVTTVVLEGVVVVVVVVVTVVVVAEGLIVRISLRVRLPLTASARVAREMVQLEVSGLREENKKKKKEVKLNEKYGTTENTKKEISKRFYNNIQKEGELILKF